MNEAALWGFIGASSLLIGAIVAFVTDLPKTVRGLILAFGAGALLAAVAFDLIAEAVTPTTAGLEVGVGFGLGAVVFYFGSMAVDHLAGEDRDRTPKTAGGRARGHGLSLVLGAVLDGIPESVVLGLSLLSGAVGVPILAAIFISNLPEAFTASADLARGGIKRRSILGLWLLVAVVSAIAAGLGYGLLHDAPPPFIGAVQSFAAGAILAMLAESAVPEAYELGGRPVALATCLGFAVSTYLSFVA